MKGARRRVSHSSYPGVGHVDRITRNVTMGDLEDVVAEGIATADCFWQFLPGDLEDLL